MRLEQRSFIAAPPARVWDLISDPPRMTTLSPELEKVDWSAASPPPPGSIFQGHNRVGPVRWSTTNIVEVVEPGRTFVWRTVEGNQHCVSRWTYRLTPRQGGCQVLERYESIGWMATAECLLGRRWMLPRGMRTTLRKLKTLAESATTNTVDEAVNVEDVTHMGRMVRDRPIRGPEMPEGGDAELIRRAIALATAAAGDAEDQEITPSEIASVIRDALEEIPELLENEQVIRYLHEAFHAVSDGMPSDYTIMILYAALGRLGEAK
jgi:uncharacterized protein YndB with AHSA1/START domain